MRGLKRVILAVLMVATLVLVVTASVATDSLTLPDAAHEEDEVSEETPLRPDMPDLDWHARGDSADLTIWVEVGGDSYRFGIPRGEANWHRVVASTVHLYGCFGALECFPATVLVRGEDLSVRAFPSSPVPDSFSTALLRSLSNVGPVTPDKGVSTFLLPEAWFDVDAPEGVFRSVALEEVDSEPEGPAIYVARPLPQELADGGTHVPVRRRVELESDTLTGRLKTLVDSPDWPGPQGIDFTREPAVKAGVVELHFPYPWWNEEVPAVQAALDLLVLTVAELADVKAVRLSHEAKGDSSDAEQKEISTPEDIDDWATIHLAEQDLGRDASPREFTLNAVGDVIPARNILPYIEEHGDGYIFEGARSDLRDGDLAFINLEAPLAESGAPMPGGIRFRGRPQTVPELYRAGISIINLANNHIMDMGREGFLETLQHLRRYGFLPVGAGLDDTHAREPLIWEGAGNRVAFIGYTHYHDVFWDWEDRETFAAGESLPGVAGLEPDRMMEDLAQARRRAPAVVVSCHWGTEYMDQPDAEYVALGQQLIDAGADAILGHHPHVLQPVEVRDGRPILYSLGNFIFDQQPLPRRQTVLARMKWRPTPAGARPTRLEMLPYLIEDMRPVPADSHMANAILDHLESISRARDTLFDREGARRIILEFESEDEDD